MLHQELKLTEIHHIRYISVLEQTEIEERLDLSFFGFLFICVDCNRKVCVIVSLVVNLNRADLELESSTCFILHQDKLDSLDLCIDEFFTNLTMSLLVFKFTY